MKEPITNLNFTKVLQELMVWASENDIKEKDLAMACQVFLMIYETNEVFGIGFNGKWNQSNYIKI